MEKYGEEMLETEEVRRYHNVHSDDEEERRQAFQSIYDEWVETNACGALGLEEEYGEMIEESEEDVALQAYKELMEIGDSTGQPYPYAAAAVKADETDLSEDLYEEAVYRLGKNSSGVDRQRIERTYDIEVDDIRQVLNERKSTEKDSLEDRFMEPALC